MLAGVPSQADVVVVGAGATGAACAAFLAEAGMDVVCVERRALAQAGARWVNGVPRAAFQQAGVALPEPPEHRGGPSPFHLVLPRELVCARGPAATIMEHDVIHVDMRHLVARLQARAAKAGVRFLPEVAVHGWAQGQAETALATDAGELRARIFVDASGLTGARLLEQPAVARADLCAAAQAVHELADRAAALAFLAEVGGRPGESVGFVGVAGGFSVLNVYVDHELETVSILTGSIPALGHPSGKAMLERFVREHAWVGPPCFGGSAAIPLRRPYERLTSERVALLGDAGCQVFSAHGSGVGAGLIAARALADTLARGGTLRQWEVAWQRQHGALLGAFDALRRFTQQLDGASVARLFASGLMEPELMKAGLNQEQPQLTLRALRTQVPALWRALRDEPALATAMLSAAARSRMVAALYARYPAEPRQVPAWSRAVDWLLRA